MVLNQLKVNKGMLHQYKGDEKLAIKIITDSACDLPKEITKEHNIEVLPLFVYLDDKEYLDGETIQYDELYSNMRDGKSYKTAQVATTRFKDAFLRLAEQGDTCIYIGFSSALSGTIQSAHIVSQEVLEMYPNFDLHIFDTKCASLGLGLIVYKAAKMVEEGRTKEEIIRAIELNMNHMEHIVTVDDLEYLLRGGRVSRSSAFIGGLLNIKPIIHVEEGKLVPIEKIRGRKKSLRRIVEIAGERGVSLEKQLIGVVHADCLEEAEKVKEQLQEQFGCKNILISVIGCVIGAHVGPGTIALMFLNEKEDN
jgi:DegV family protein with EDD domain